MAFNMDTDSDEMLAAINEAKQEYKEKEAKRLEQLTLAALFRKMGNFGDNKFRLIQQINIKAVKQKFQKARASLKIQRTRFNLETRSAWPTTTQR
jgi:hypothetical protein